MSFDSFYSCLLENETFLAVCYSIFAVMLFVYIYTGMKICEQRGCGKKTSSTCDKEDELPEISPFDCLTENWLIARDLVESPLNIEDCNRNYILSKLNWKNHGVKPKSLTLENNGESLAMYAIYGNVKPSVGGANLPASYNFVSVTFRWGQCNKEGSDHHLNGVAYPLEMQLLYRTENCDEVVSSSGLLIIAFLFEISEHNKNLDPMTRYLKRVRLSCSKTKLSSLPLSSFIPMSTGGFYCYIGTLTVPPYYGGVRWLVFSKPLPISESQMREFRQLLNSESMPIKKRGRSPRSL